MPDIINREKVPRELTGVASGGEEVGVRPGTAAFSGLSAS